MEVEIEQYCLELQARGWSQAVLDKVFLAEIASLPHESARQVFFEEALIFGSPLFQKLWSFECQAVQPQQAEKLLKLAMFYMDMPDELSGEAAEITRLLSRIHPDLSPHSPFWHQFSQTIRHAFSPADFIADSGNQRLKGQLHQFRYVISCQQVQWVRQHFRKLGMTDGQALVAYFQAHPNLDCQLWESSRLHNKAFVNKGQVTYPDQQPYQANIKILHRFHTEFILDREGRFLNVLDPESSSQNGLVNGASFNYGKKPSLFNHSSHYYYDVKSPAQWDPQFRKLEIRNGGQAFKAPQNNRGSAGYHTSRSHYAISGKSAKSQVDAQVKNFEKSLVEKLKGKGYLKYLWNKVKNKYLRL
ncbi:hypothetical protein SCRDD08_01826 [Streptococcus cristatus]|uniref:DUF3114 domain-containing protein n=2 Tax=Streptococcus cristatus TaxID=45634 RepID=A0A139MYP1_STRCR|nr:DUF3114 domain-containing protein [Streptococcus cristatus]KXT68621.1 hypothetical protein SCRDD08_01826 [Streptococcus cristatus]